MVSKEPLLKDCPELLTHLGAERPVLGKCLKAVFDQFRGHIGQHLDDCPQVRRVVLELLTRFSSLKRRSAQGLVSIPFIASTISMRFSQLSSQLTRRPRRKTPASIRP